jgi:FtsP/CotA-like multicopper oxidase with cupredoxin domain
MVPRRQFLKGAGLAILTPGLPVLAPGPPAVAPVAPAPGNAQTPPDLTLHVREARVELAPDKVITTTTYNGAFPGPIIRAAVGQHIIVDVHNETAAFERLHWQGQSCPTDPPGVPAGGSSRFGFTAARSGLFFYHSDTIAASDLSAGLYSGQAGLILVESRHHAGDFDREVCLVLKEFEPTLQRRQHGWEVAYQVFTINGRMLGHGEPVRVNAGERVLFHVLNASATETRRLALPGHTFEVVGLDGNPVPTPTRVTTLQAAPAERVSAVVAMNQPGVWILGELADDDRKRGLGTVVEYAGRGGEPTWHKPTTARWDYTRFGQVRERPRADETVDVVLSRRSATRGGFKRWSLNGAELAVEDAAPGLQLRSGVRYRLRIHNASDDACPIELRQNPQAGPIELQASSLEARPAKPLELVSLAGRPTGRLFKDVILLRAGERAEVEFVAGNVGCALLQSSQRLYRDFGLMTRVSCV